MQRIVPVALFSLASVLQPELSVAEHKSLCREVQLCDKKLLQGPDLLLEGIALDLPFWEHAHNACNPNGIASVDGVQEPPFDRHLCCMVLG